MLKQEDCTTERAKYKVYKTQRVKPRRLWSRSENNTMVEKKKRVYVALQKVNVKLDETEEIKKSISCMKLKNKQKRN